MLHLLRMDQSEIWKDLYINVFFLKWHKTKEYDALTVLCLLTPVELKSHDLSFDINQLGFEAIISFKLPIF